LCRDKVSNDGKHTLIAASRPTPSKGNLCSRVEHYHEETSAGCAFLGEDYVLLIGQLVVQEVENREALQM
jgi:hypothetical protein